MMSNMKDIIWLSGFIDADGCIRLSKGWKNKKGQHSLVPQITIHNTSVKTMEFVAEVISKIIPTFQISWKKLKSRNHSEMATITIMGMKRVKSLLNKLLPYLVTKKLEGKLLLEFIKTRETATSHNAHYSEKEYKIYFALKHLKKTRNLRDYTPNIKDILNEDIVRTNAKSLEAVEISARLTEKEKKDWAKNLVSKYRWGLKK